MFLLLVLAVAVARGDPIRYTDPFYMNFKHPGTHLCPVAACPCVPRDAGRRHGPARMDR